MSKSKSAGRQAAKKPSRRSQLKKATAKRAIALLARVPVRTIKMKSHEDGAAPTKRKRPQADGRDASTANNNVTPSSGLITLLMQWTPIGILLRQQAVLANAMGQAAPTSRR